MGLAGIALVMGLVLAACNVWEVEPDIDMKASDHKAKGKATVTLTDTTYKVEYDGKTASGNCEKTTSGTTSTYKDLPGFGATVKDGKLVFLQVDTADIKIGWAGSQAKKSVDGEENTIDIDDIELIILDDAE
ncbi:hypothetical protein AGMMS49579_27260 [Spirochaetia bacterium]|nr:hypothetical protein AGMMS49579_27260 [Spirochaetia bacterium]